MDDLLIRINIPIHNKWTLSKVRNTKDLQISDIVSVKWILGMKCSLVWRVKDPKKLKISHFMNGLIIVIAVLNILMKENAYEGGVEMPFTFFHCQDSYQKVRVV